MVNEGVALGLLGDFVATMKPSAFAQRAARTGYSLSLLVSLQEIDSEEGLSTLWNLASERILVVVLLVSPVKQN